MPSASPSQADVHRIWNLPPPAGTDTTREQYVAHLRAIGRQFPSLDFHLSPAGFEGDTRGAFFPHSRETTWHSGQEILKASRSTVVINRLPPFWQMEIAVHRAVRDAGAVPFLNAPSNTAVGAAAVSALEADTVITSAKHSRAFSRALQAREQKVSTWVVIHEMSAAGPWESDSLIEGARIIANESHIFPGVPLFVQCIDLARELSLAFHVADGFSLANSRVSSDARFPFPFFNLALPFSAMEKGACVCGKQLFVKA
jgi:hypothetical protein